MIGKAAHIHAAAPGPGARRYLASMTREERTHISNAIWLCATHADLIDRDEVTYTADVLREMKAEHEEHCAERQRNALSVGETNTDLIAIGPDIVFVGKFLGIEGEVWSFHMQSFIDGDVHTLITLADRYEQTTAKERFVLVNELGDGRALRAKPSVTKDSTGSYTVRCPVFPSVERIQAVDIPKMWALSDSHDLMTSNGKWAMVSGVDALPQQVKTCLSHQVVRKPVSPRFWDEVCRVLQPTCWFTVA